MVFVDSNIFLRHLTNDDLERGPACFGVIQALEQGTLSAWTSDLVIAEVVLVLSKKRTYNLDRQRIADLLLPLVELPGLKVPHKRMYRRVFALYTAYPIDYVDAFHAALVERLGGGEVLSYDAHFDLLPQVTRREPPARSQG
jgi:predicted nucleic acid-binding protein